MNQQLEKRYLHFRNDFKQPISSGTHNRIEQRERAMNWSFIDRVFSIVRKEFPQAKRKQKVLPMQASWRTYNSALCWWIKGRVQDAKVQQVIVSIGTKDLNWADWERNPKQIKLKEELTAIQVVKYLETYAQLVASDLTDTRNHCTWYNVF